MLRCALKSSVLPTEIIIRIETKRTNEFGGTNVSLTKCFCAELLGALRRCGKIRLDRDHDLGCLSSLVSFDKYA